jgi:predicted ribosomally synthesized peptide with SipW-like signal peptide
MSTVKAICLLAGVGVHASMSSSEWASINPIDRAIFHDITTGHALFYGRARRGDDRPLPFEVAWDACPLVLGSKVLDADGSFRDFSAFRVVSRQASHST